jgi:hypothetical protein
VVDIESRKATVLAHFKQAPFEPRIEAIRAFHEAAKYFGLKQDFDDLEREIGGSKSSEGWRERSERRAALTSQLAHLMAEVLFGKPGRGRQVKDWTEQKLYALGRAHAHFRSVSDATDAQFAEMLSKNRWRIFGKDPEAIRQRLPTAKRLFESLACDCGLLDCDHGF